MSIDREELLAGLNDEQRAAVEHRGGPLMVLAGPGSGKTRVITSRMVLSIIDEEHDPSRILAVTFTNKAAAEMKQRVGAMLGEGASDLPTTATFHSACVRILRRETAASGLPRAFSIIDTSDTRKLIRKSLMERRLPAEPKDIRSAARAISAYKNGRGDGSSVGPVLGDYMEACRKLGAVDFDDLLLHTHRILAEEEEVRLRWRRRWRQVLVDEYQDTNPVQARIVRLLVGPGSPDLCVVGDADQAIYGFRNATPRAFEELKQHLPGITTIHLGTNYRSTSDIVGLCRELMRGGEGERVTLVPGRGSGSRPRMLRFKDDRSEAEWVTKDIVARGGGAVLLRTNAQTRLFEDALASRGVAYRTVGTIRFYERSEVKDALSWLRAALNPEDMMSFARAAGSIPQGVGQTTLERIQEAIAEGYSLEEAASMSGRASRRVEELLEKLQKVRQACAKGPVAALRVTLEDAGLMAHHSSGEGGTERAENLSQLLDAAAGQPDEENSTEEFLQRIALSSEEVEEEGAEVLLMTVHGSKGREFKNVYVCGVEEGLFPHSQSRTPEDREEERRLLYVACSRAEENLTVTTSARRFLHGETREQEESRFLAPVLHLLSGGMGLPGLEAAPAPADTPAGTGRGRRHLSRAAGGPRLQASQATEGARVEHAKFGIGTILKVRWAEEGSIAEEVEVSFDSGPPRRLRLDLAPMKLAG